MKRYQERTGGEVTPEMIKSMHLKEMALSQLVEEPSCSRPDSAWA